MDHVAFQLSSKNRISHFNSQQDENLCEQVLFQGACEPSSGTHHLEECANTWSKDK